MKEGGAGEKVKEGVRLESGEDERVEEERMEEEASRANTEVEVVSSAWDFQQDSTELEPPDLRMMQKLMLQMQQDIQEMKMKMLSNI